MQLNILRETSETSDSVNPAGDDILALATAVGIVHNPHLNGDTPPCQANHTPRRTVLFRLEFDCGRVRTRGKHSGAA